MDGGLVCDTGEGAMLVDYETGEVLTPVVATIAARNVSGDCETGEKTQDRIVYQRSKFRVPRSALKTPVFESAVVGPAKEEKDNCFDLEILALPLLMFIPVWAIVLYLMLEVLFHNWSHSHRPGEICKTPMRPLFQVSCAECVAKQQMLKVGKLQDERTMRIHSHRILNYDYSKFGIPS